MPETDILWVNFCIFRLIQDVNWTYRSSHWRCSLRKGVLRNSAKFTGKHLCQSLFFNKVAGLRPATLLKKRLWHRCFPLNFAKLPRTPFLQNTSGRGPGCLLNTLCTFNLRFVSRGFSLAYGRLSYKSKNNLKNWTQFLYYCFEVRHAFREMSSIEKYWRQQICERISTNMYPFWLNFTVTIRYFFHKIFNK